jgi:hypothetical protein
MSSDNINKPSRGVAKSWGRFDLGFPSGAEGGLPPATVEIRNCWACPILSQAIDLPAKPCRDLRLGAARAGGATVKTRGAVAMRVAPHPPNRTVLALLTHTVPTLDAWQQTAHWAKGAGSQPGEVRLRAAPENAPRSNGCAGSAAVVPPRCAVPAGPSIQRRRAKRRESERTRRVSTIIPASKWPLTL